MSSLNVLSWSQDGLCQRSALEGAGVHVIKHNLLHVALHFLHLAQDNAALTLDL